MQEIKIRDSKSDHFEVINYPDGQQNLKLFLDKLNVKDTVQIICSIKNFKELEILLCAVEALDKNDFIIEKIEFVYLFGLRSDRAFEPGMPNYLRDVLLPIIRNLKSGIIEILHPHSEKLIPEYPKITRSNFLEVFIRLDDKKIIWINGDESSRNYNLFDCKSFKKTRDENGDVFITLEKETVKYLDVCKEQPILIFDDLCDGGATFIHESKILRELYPNRKLYLYVTHGLFSKGIDHVAEHFDHIYCTNSYQDINHHKVTQFKVI